jgi:hypothetical protein
MKDSHSRATGRRPAALRCAFVLLAVLAAAQALAQGGPPMITDDPDTPGDGHWEINLGSIGSRSAGGWLIEALDADINYGWGDRVQLKFDTPWNAAQQVGGWVEGLGNSQVGVKWRFLDNVEASTTASIYPQLSWALNPGSTHRGLANPGRTLFLPVEAATRVGPLDIDGELGRSLTDQGTDAWIAGIIVAHSFSPKFEAMLEMRGQFAPGGSGTIFNAGGRWDLFSGLSLQASAGRQMTTSGTAGADRASVLYYLGVQIRR